MSMDVICRAERVAALAKYLKALPSAEVAPSPMGTVVVDDAVVKLMEEEVVRANVSAAKMNNYKTLTSHCNIIEQQT